jgi:hypothetical protein
MNKKTLSKKNLILIVAGGLILAGIVGAVVYSYISNLVQVGLWIESPVEIKINDVKDYLDIQNVISGEEISFEVSVYNKTKKEISGYPLIVIESNGNPFEGGEVEKIMANETEITNRICVLEKNNENLKIDSLSEWEGEAQKLIMFYDYDSPQGQTCQNLYQTTLTPNQEIKAQVKIKISQGLAPGYYKISGAWVYDVDRFLKDQYQSENN